MKIYLRRKGMTFIPLTEHDADNLKRIKDEQIIYVDYKKPRNPQFHRKFMSMVRTVWKNQDQYPTVENVLSVIKVETGHYISIFYGTGKGLVEIRTPTSIAFDKMDELKFDYFYHRAVAVCLTHFLPETSVQELEEYIDKIEGYADQAALPHGG
jgi:hypothetical protein